MRIFNAIVLAVFIAIVAPNIAIDSSGISDQSVAQAQITFVSGSHSDQSSGTSITPSEPASCAENDLVIAAVMWADDDSSGGTIADQPDFTQIDTFAEATGSDGIVYAGYKVRGTDAGDGYEFSSSSGTDNNQASLLCFRGVDTSTPLDVTYVKASHYIAYNNSATGAAKAITTNTDNAVVLLLQLHNASLSSGTGEPPTNYTEAFEAALTQNDDGFYSAYRTITSASTETPGAYNHTDTNNFSDSRSFTIALKPAAAASPPSFSSGPTISPATNGYTISGTVDQDATVYAVACIPSETTPDATELKAGDCGSGADAAISANEAWTQDVGDSFALTVAGAYPRHDIHILASNGNGDSSISSTADQNRSADAGQAIQVLASISATSPCDGDSYFDPDVAAGDVIEYDTTSDNSYTVAFTDDCDFTIDAGGDTSQDHFDINFQDVSAASDFTSGPPNWSVGDDTIWVNNTAPAFDTGADVNVAYTIDEVIISVDLDALFTDADGDSLSYEVTSGELPSGITLSTNTLSGTPDTESEAGDAFTITATDTPGDTDVGAFLFCIIDTITMPTITDSDITDAIADELSAFACREDPTLTVTFECDNAEAANEILTQDPAASTEVTKDQVFSAVGSTGPTCSLRRRRAQ